MSLQDYLHEDAHELRIKNGDFVLGKSHKQALGLILSSHKGDWRQSPWVGVNLREWINDEGSVTALKHIIQSQLEIDGAQVNQLEIVRGKIYLDADYED